jgi:hypothetical protein
MRCGLVNRESSVIIDWEQAEGKRHFIYAPVSLGIRGWRYMVARQLLTERTLHIIHVIVILLVVLKNVCPVNFVTSCGTTLRSCINLSGREAICSYGSRHQVCNAVVLMTIQGIAWILHLSIDKWQLFVSVCLAGFLSQCHLFLFNQNLNIYNFVSLRRVIQGSTKMAAVSNQAYVKETDLLRNLETFHILHTLTCTWALVAIGIRV